MNSYKSYKGQTKPCNAFDSTVNAMADRLTTVLSVIDLNPAHN